VAENGGDVHGRFSRRGGAATKGIF
jgi:hypothetical protein